MLAPDRHTGRQARVVAVSSGYLGVTRGDECAPLGWRNAAKATLRAAALSAALPFPLPRWLTVHEHSLPNIQFKGPEYLTLIYD